MSLYYGVICPKCGDVELSREEYQTQMLAPGCGWRCPECWGPAEWDDSKHDASCEAARASVEREIRQLPQPMWRGVLGDFVGGLVRSGAAKSPLPGYPHIIQELVHAHKEMHERRIARRDFADVELLVCAAGYGGRSLVSHLGYQPEDG